MIETPAMFQSAEQALSVAELNQRVRQLLEQGFPLLWVRGELSNLSFAASGHFYFTLKDEQAQVGCVMFRSRAQTLGWKPAAGQRVEARARVTLFEAGGRYQLQIDTLKPAGQGDLHARFLALRDRLAAEGLFDAARKRPLPSLPRRIGIVTSPQAAALRDVVSTLRRRAPHIDLIVYPAPVQGAGVAGRIIEVLREADRRAECDLLILCRGGGSLEDLWCFNDESLARALRSLTLPVICGVGHETDFTIADFAADQRAPTPTAAAELASPDRAALLWQIAGTQRRLTGAARRRMDLAGQLLDHRARLLRHPAEQLAAARQALSERAARLTRSGRATAGDAREAVQLATGRLNRLDLRATLLLPQQAGLEARMRRLTLSREAERRLLGQRLAATAARLTSLDPRRVVDRGYAIVTDGDGALVTGIDGVELKRPIYVNLRNGCLQATVDNKLLSRLPADDQTLHATLPAGIRDAKLKP
jgi:exodeoxyribonuclease VII large subunit